MPALRLYHTLRPLYGALRSARSACGRCATLRPSGGKVPSLRTFHVGRFDSYGAQGVGVSKVCDAASLDIVGAQGAWSNAEVLFILGKRRRERFRHVERRDPRCVPTAATLGRPSPLLPVPAQSLLRSGSPIFLAAARLVAEPSPPVAVDCTSNGTAWPGHSACTFRR